MNTVWGETCFIRYIFIIFLEGRFNRENLKLNTLKDKLVHKRIRWYGCILRTNKIRIPQKVLKINLKGKC